MVDPVIDEHFRRSLGADYMNLFGKRLNQLKSTSSSVATVVRKSPQLSPMESDAMETRGQQPDMQRTNETSPPPSPTPSPAKRDSEKQSVKNIEMSVDDHFAKALGDTWKQLQQNKSRASPIEADDSDLNSDAINDSNANDDDDDDGDDDDDDRSSSKSDLTNGDHR